MKRIFYNPLSDPNSEITLHGCGHEKCSPDFSNGPGVRKKYIIHYVISGKGYYEVNGEKYTLKKGDAFAIWPDDLVTYYTDKSKPLEFCWIMFDGSEARKCYECVGFTRDNLVINHVNGNILKTITNCLDLAEKNNGILSQLKLSCYIIEFLTYLEKFDKTSVPQQTKTKKYINSATTHIEHYYGQGIGVSDIAYQLGLERSYLYRIFLKEKGMSPNEYLMKFRINKSKKLIKLGMDFKEIADAVGISDVSYFSKLFKKSEGITPSQYKRNNS